MGDHWVACGEREWIWLCCCETSPVAALLPLLLQLFTLLLLSLSLCLSRVSRFQIHTRTPLLISTFSPHVKGDWRVARLCILTVVVCLQTSPASIIILIAAGTFFLGRGEFGTLEGVGLYLKLDTGTAPVYCTALRPFTGEGDESTVSATCDNYLPAPLPLTPSPSPPFPHPSIPSTVSNPIISLGD